MKTFHQFLTICEAIYDRDQPSDVELKVGKIGKERKKTAPERRRTKAIGGGKTARQASTRVQQPQKERGSAKLSPKEAQRKAYLERKKGQSGSTKSKDLEKQASKLLTKKTTKAVSPKYKPQKDSGYSRPERQKLRRASDRLLSDIAKGKEKPASHYDPGVRRNK